MVLEGRLCGLVVGECGPGRCCVVLVVSDWSRYVRLNWLIGICQESSLPC